MTIKQAANVSAGVCDNCDRIHVQLMDDKNEVFAEFVLGIEDVNSFIVAIIRFKVDLEQRIAKQGRVQ